LLVTIKRPTISPYKADENILDTKSHVVKDVVKDNVIELSERQMNIIAFMSMYPTITASGIAEKMSGKESITTRTIQRDIAFLQNHDIIKREGGRKEGKWVVLKK